jgi:hypothetical protein
VDILGVCRPGPSHVWAGKPTRTMRVIFEILYEQPMHETWRLRRGCPTEHCANPAHWRLHHHLTPGLTLKPLPVTYEEKLVQPDTVEDVYELIMMRDERDPEAIYEWLSDYSPSLIDTALAQIKAEAI